VNPKSLVLGFAPLVAFSLLTRYAGVEVGALAGLVIAVGVLISGRRGGVKMLPAVQASSLAVVALVDLIGGHGTDDFLKSYGQGLVSLALAAAILISASFAPFTAEFARAEVSAEVASTKAFHRLNRRISTAWGLAVLVLGICHLVAGTLPNNDRRGQLLLDWGGLVIAFGLALRYTKAVAAAQAGAGHPEAASQAG
jgi:hypothetical protein